MALMRTFAGAHSMILNGLEAEGYTIKRALKVPQAVAPDGSHTLRFKAQAIYLEAPALGIDHSMHCDPRPLTYEQFRACLARWLVP